MQPLFFTVCNALVPMFILVWNYNSISLQMVKKANMQSNHRYIVLMNSKSKISVIDLFGWNAKEESIPMNIVDLCVKCHKRNPRRSVTCK